MPGAATTADPAAAQTERLPAGAPEPTPSERRGLPLPDAPGRYMAIECGEQTTLLQLVRPVTHVGRGLDCELRLDDHLVSRRHAIVVMRSGGARVLDDRSANGLVVNGVRVSESRLHHGDVIVLGRTVLRYVEA